MLIKSLQISNLLSYGEQTGVVELGNLNILIGPNGSGKSNFLEAISLLQAAPEQLTRPFRDGEEEYKTGCTRAAPTAPQRTLKLKR